MNWEYQMYMQPCGIYPNPNAHLGMSTPLQSPDFPPSLVEEKPNDHKKKFRRYKTPSPQMLRQRRSAANERERKRMDILNVAYDKLRMVLPDLDSGKKLSKFETLQMAQKYIECLADLLKETDSARPQSKREPS